MTEWTNILESLHSALIDEITTRFPEPKPTLGMPMRRQEFLLEDLGLGSRASFAGLNFVVGESEGIVMIIADPAANPSAAHPSVSAGELWKGVYLRAGAEFSRRGIRPIFTPMQLTAEGKLPRGGPQPKRFIWIPLFAGSGRCFLGLGV
jgi:hypothetical protein